jgi:hypothetical protein
VEKFASDFAAGQWFSSGIPPPIKQTAKQGSVIHGGKSVIRILKLKSWTITEIP